MKIPFTLFLNGWEYANWLYLNLQLTTLEENQQGQMFQMKFHFCNVLAFKF